MVSANKFLGNTAQRWLAVAALLSAAAGAAVGIVLSGQVAGTVTTTVSQSILVDASQFDERDISAHARRRFVAVSDDQTSFTAAAEISTGDEVAIDVPIINLSTDTASVELTLEWPPQVQVNAESFWTSETFVKSVSAGTITRTGSTPSPAPFTTTDEQSKNATVETNNASDVSGSATIGPQTANATVHTTEPSGLGSLVSSRGANLAATNTAPIDSVPTTTTQTALTTCTVVKPDADLPDGSSWCTGQLLVDIDADGTKEIVHFALTRNAGATVTHMDMSSDDGDLGETTGGPLSGQTPRQTGPDDDERLTSSGADVRLGPFYLFAISFASNGSSASILSKTWFTAAVAGTDLDGDGDADDTFHVLLSDRNSDGIYETMDLSIGDANFGEGSLTGGSVHFHPTDNSDDERLTAASDTSSGTHNIILGVNPFGITFDTSPGAGP